MKPVPMATAPRGKPKPFTIVFLALVIGGSNPEIRWALVGLWFGILLMALSIDPEIRWALVGLWFGILLMALSIGALCEMMED